MSRGWILICGLFFTLGLVACSPGKDLAGAVGGIPTPIETITPVKLTTSMKPTTVPLSSTPLLLTVTPTIVPTLLLPDSPTPLPSSCLLQGGRILRDWQATTLLPQPLQYRVYLPPCYDESPERRYPVLYLIHGQSFTDAQWERLGAGEVASLLIAAGEVPPFLIVMPRDRVWTQPSEDRFGEALVQVLIPAIDEEYRTLSSRTFRAIGGLSRGASWAIHLGLSQWELFSAIGAHSLPIFWEDTPFLPKWLDDIPLGAMPRIYVDIGEDDRPEIMNSATWFENLLSTRGIPHEWHLFQGAHDEEYWRGHVEQYLRWYAAGW